MMPTRQVLGPRLWFGVAVLTMGVLWTLDNLGIVDARPFWNWWPLVFVTVGISKLAGWGGGVRRPLGGVIWIAIGLLVLTHTLDYLPWGDVWDLYPLFLVLIGAAIVWRSLRGPFGTQRGRHRLGASAVPSSDAGPVADSDTFSCLAVWAGADRKSTSAAFRGGDFTAIMGGGEVDLRAARPVPGGAVVDVFVLMGGIDVIVPADWQVVNEIFAVMGGIEDSRTAAPVDGDKVLYIKGTVFMGSVEIKN